jgi:hypothetical protein
MFTMPFEFGDVVFVPFPFTSHRASKKRPAVAFGRSWLVIAIRWQRQD